MSRPDRQTQRRVTRLFGTTVAAGAILTAGATAHGGEFGRWQSAVEPAAFEAESPPLAPPPELAPVLADEMVSDQPAPISEPAARPESNGGPVAPAVVDAQPAAADPFADPFDRTPSRLLRPLSDIRIGLDTPAKPTNTDEQFARRGSVTLTPLAWPIQSPEAIAYRFYCRPLWFEDPNLERCGYACGGPCCQPVVSGLAFLGNTALLPYRMVAEPACEPVPTKPFCPPGCKYDFCENYLPPADAGGTAAEAAAVAGLILLIP